MYICEIFIKIPDEDALDEICDMLDGFIDSLYRHGHILYRKIPMINNNNNIKLIVECSEKDSLDKKNHKSYVKQKWEKIENIIQNKIYFKFIGNSFIEYTKCYCNQSFFILDSDLLISPIRCGYCFEPIPIYLLPETYEDGRGYDNIFFWRKNYVNTFELWFDGTIGEKYHLKQMANIKSSLSKQGLIVCQNIERVTGKPTYYFLDFQKHKKDTCPSCNKVWKLEKSISDDNISYLCIDCKIVSR